MVTGGHSKPLNSYGQAQGDPELAADVPLFVQHTGWTISLGELQKSGCFHFLAQAPIQIAKFRDKPPPGSKVTATLSPTWPG